MNSEGTTQSHKSFDDISFDTASFLFFLFSKVMETVEVHGRINLSIERL